MLFLKEISMGLIELTRKDFELTCALNSKISNQIQV